jgi:hypothetical protein
MQKYRSPETCKYLQKKYYSIFLDSIHDPESRIQLDISLMRRVINMFDPFEIDFSNKVDISACFEALLAIGVADRTKVIKTWLHGWATSHRIKGDSLFNCLLGCGGAKDSLSHYLQCPRIFGAFSFLWPETSSDPLVRCGLCEPSKESLSKVACMFAAYHSIKSEFRREFEANASIQYQTDKFWVLFAQSLAAEAVARALTSTLFDLAKFTHFVALQRR